MPGEKEEITVSYEPPKGYTLTWKLGDKELMPDDTAGTRITINITDLIAPSTPLTLSLTKNGQSYSNSINVYVVDVLDTGVKVEIAGTEYTEGSAPYRISSNSTFATSDTPAQVRQLQLKATAINANGNEATIKDVFFEIAEESPEGIATIDDNGLITFTAGAYTTDNNPLVVNVWSTNSKDKPMKVTFDVYYATVADATQLVNTVNTVFGAALQQADKNWSSDWYGYKAGFTEDKKSQTVMATSLSQIEGSYSFTAPTHGITSIDTTTRATAQINSVKVKLSFGEISLSSDIIKMWFSDSDDSYKETSKLITIGDNQEGTVTITLPYNQGTATITYNNINVSNPNGTSNETTNSYKVEFKQRVGTTEGQSQFNTIVNNSSDIVQLITY